MKKNLFLLLGAALLITTGCDNKTKNPGGAISIPNGDQLTQSFYADQTTGSVTIVAEDDWTSQVTETTKSAGDNPGWIYVSPSWGEAGRTPVTITLYPNDTQQERSAEIAFFCKGQKVTVNVTQKKTNQDGTTPDPGGVIPPKEASLVSRIRTESYYEQDLEEVEVWDFSYDGLNRVSGIHRAMTYYDDGDYYEIDYTLNYTPGTVVMKVAEVELNDPDPVGKSVQVRKGTFSKRVGRKPVLRTKADDGDDDEGDYLYTAEVIAQLTNDRISSAVAMEYRFGRDGSSDESSTETWSVGYDGENRLSDYYSEWQDNYEESSNGSTTKTYDWTEGNLTRVTDRYGVSQATYGSGFVNDPYINIDLNAAAYQTEFLYYGVDDYRVFHLLGLYGERSTQMVATEGYEDSDYEFTFEYLTDGLGRINQIKAIREGLVEEVISIEYQ